MTECPDQDCSRHEIRVQHDEMVSAPTKEEAIDVSLSQYEQLGTSPAFRDGLEPTWIDPHIKPLVVQPKSLFDLATLVSLTGDLVEKGTRK